jgi:serine/threonine protein kinase
MAGPVPGSHVGPYEIVGAVGAGGMGEVYRARDPRLERDVAIKILPPAFALDDERIRRFEREARILASLDHAHIARIHGIEEIAGSKALVLEFVEGPTLAEQLDRGPLDLHESLRIARQIADAIETAHEQGVIHRDLKPANIKLRRDGVVKVLDFGLARSDAPAATGALDTATVTALTSTGGTVMGTAAYMSPEQARGRHVDKRSDIWSFGCILFEMLAGRRPFQGDTVTDTLADVLQRDPGWEALPRGTPPAIRALITRCLQKDPRNRLRDIGDARIAIDETLAGPPPQSPMGAASTSRIPSVIPLAAVALASAAVTYGLAALAGPGRETSAAPVFDHVVRLVASPAHEFSPVISPDGKWVAYLSNARGPTDVWLRSVSGGDAQNLTAGFALEISALDAIGGIDVSPDGSQLAFVAGTPGVSSASMSTFVIPVPLRGTPRRLLERAQGMRWSPDGRHVTYIRPGGSVGDRLMVADADGQNERELVKHEGARHIHWPRWGANGRHVYFNYGFETANAEQNEIFRVAVAGGAPERVVATARRAISPLPGPDGRGLFFAANPDSVETNLWWRDLARGSDHRLTFGIGEYGSPSVSADGRRLVATVSDLRQSLQRIPLDADRAAAPLPMTEGHTGDIDPSWSPDGRRIVFSSSRSGDRNIWSMQADGSNVAALTTGASLDERPVYSPDGTQVAFVSDRGGRRGIWMVSADGGSPRQVAAAHALTGLSWSRDGTRLVYSAPGGELPQLDVLEVASGRITRLPTSHAANSPAWSPVEDVIAYIETVQDRGGFVRFMTSDGRPLSRGPADDVTELNNGFVTWSPDGKRLAGVGLPGARAGSIWIIDPSARTPFKRLLDLAPDTVVRGASWSRDGRSLVIGEWRSTRDIILAERSR